MRKYIPELGVSYLTKLIVLFFVYFLTAKIGLSLHSLHPFVPLIWLPTGISLAVLILYGYNLWPAIFVGSLLVDLTTGAPFLVTLIIALGNSAEAMIGTYLLRKYITLYRCFERLPNTLGFILLSAIATLLSATLGTISLLIGHIIVFGSFSETWFIWWIGDFLGALVVTPFLLTWLKPTRPWNPDNLGLPEILGLVLTIFGLSYIIFWHSFLQVGGISFVYLISLPLIWGGLRFGSRGMTASIFVTSIMAVAATVLGHGPFIRTSLSESLLFLQIFIGTVSITFLIFLSVVKEKKRATLELESHVNKLEEALLQISSADQAKNNFIAILAHELRNPLAPILSAIEHLKIQTKETSQTSKIVNVINENIHTITRLLDDLLDISRISREKFNLQMEMFTLLPIIERSVQSVTPLLKSRGHSLSVFVVKKTVRLFGDPLRVEQMVVNVLNNAAKYTPNGGKIKLAMNKDENNVYISIKDTGMGLEKERLQEIFEPFLQVNQKQMLSHGGLGIGLSLTKKLAELHGGGIVAESEGLGKGTTFTITLPTPKNTNWIPIGEKREKIRKPSSKIKPAQSALPIVHEESKKIPAKKKNYKKHKILVVDDNKAAAQGLAKLLQYKKHIVDMAYESQIALKKVKSFSPDVVILDIGMPVMDGYEVAKKIREKFSPNITLIALTGYGQEDDKDMAAQVGFDYHLTKPVSIVDIEKILGTL